MEFAIKMLEFLEEHPLPEDKYFTPVVVMKEVDSQESCGVFRKDITGNYSYEV